jgi:hypothetical protein
VRVSSYSRLQVGSIGTSQRKWDWTENKLGSGDGDGVLVHRELESCRFGLSNVGVVVL